MPAYLDICPVCGRKYQNYQGTYGRLYCSVRCQFSKYEELCIHNYEVGYCIECEEDNDENSIN